MDKELKTLFIYYAPHPIHKAFASTITDECCACGVKFSAVAKNLIKSLFNRGNFDVLFLESGTCLPLAITKKKSNTKIVLLNADPLFYDLPKSNFLKRKIMEFLLSYVDYIIAVSEMNKRYASEYFPKEKIYVVNSYGDKSNQKIMSNPQSNNILFIATHGKEKGLENLINALKIINKDKIKYQLYFLGLYDLDHQEELPWFHKEGFKRNIDPYLKKCSIYVHPAYFDSYPVTVFEAMSAGLIPVITKQTGQVDLLEKNNLNELILENNNPETIAHKVEEINKKSDKWKEKVSLECKKISSEYTKETQLKKFKNVFNQIFQDFS